MTLPPEQNTASPNASSKSTGNTNLCVGVWVVLTTVGGALKVVAETVRSQGNLQRNASNAQIVTTRPATFSRESSGEPGPNKTPARLVACLAKRCLVQKEKTTARPSPVVWKCSTPCPQVTEQGSASTPWSQHSHDAAGTSTRIVRSRGTWDFALLGARRWVSRLGNASTAP